MYVYVQLETSAQLSRLWTKHSSV